MHKRRRWLLSLLALLITAAMMAGCGGSGSTTKAPAKTEAGKTEAGKTEAEKTEAKKTEAPEADEDETEAPATEAPDAEDDEGDEDDEPENGVESDFDEHMTITASFWDIANMFPSEDAFDGVDDVKAYIESKFNLTIEPVNVGWGDADEKYTTWAQSGQLPDIVGAAAFVGGSRYYQWVEDGVVRALPADMDKYPLSKERLAAPEVTAYNVDDQHWFYPRYTYQDVADWSMDRGLLIRRDWLDALGLDMPETEEEYIDTMVAFAQNDPDGNGQDDTVGYLPAQTWLLTSQAWTGYGFTDGRWIFNEDGDARMAIAEKSTLPLMSFLRRMFKAGGMDPDFATIANEDAIEKFAQGRVGMFSRQVSPKHLDAIYQKWVILQPDVDFFEAVEFAHGPLVVDNNVRFAEKIYWSESYFEANVDDEKMDRILSLYEWIISDEGMAMCAYGIEGKHYEVEADGSIKLLLDKDPETGQFFPLSNYAPMSGIGHLATWVGDNLQYQNPSLDPRLIEMATVERDYRKTEWDDPQVNWPLQGINVPEKEEMAAIRFGDDWSRFIMDESDASDEELYEELLSNWNANGYERACESITAEAQNMGIID